MNMIRNSIHAIVGRLGSIAAHPISGGTAPDKLPMTVLLTSFRLAHML
ncbi:hypothetical protein J6TS1_04310 [Siminovitchia terrae]|uniref:Uncharacterized protein n=1 Tax=Siminovitchia terrae TaxID=1914933 RepID=A0ABQ4KRA9_SIMTE|nr:hypothetical protein J6TS1_04310 [Siminovitchia terrae]